LCALNFVSNGYMAYLKTISLVFVVSVFQGHAAPILYAAWVEAGFLKQSDILNLRKIESDLEGHPTPVRLMNLCTVIYIWYLGYNVRCI
jgi:hypothetical protein